MMMKPLLFAALLGASNAQAEEPKPLATAEECRADPNANCISDLTEYIAFWDGAVWSTMADNGKVQIHKDGGKQDGHVDARELTSVGIRVPWDPICRTEDLHFINDAVTNGIITSESGVRAKVRYEEWLKGPRAFGCTEAAARARLEDILLRDIIILYDNNGDHKTGQEDDTDGDNMLTVSDQAKSLK
jgi:hypothetical protein